MVRAAIEALSRRAFRRHLPCMYVKFSEYIWKGDDYLEAEAGSCRTRR